MDTLNSGALTELAPCDAMNVEGGIVITTATFFTILAVSFFGGITLGAVVNT